MGRVVALMVLIVMVLLSGCCVSEETRQLAQGIHLYQVKQAERVGKLVGAAREKGVVSVEDLDLILEDQRALVESARALSEILGEPRAPVEVTP